MGSDFNGDGRDDILWTNAFAGTLSNWLGQANGGFVVNDANAMTLVESTWAPNWNWEILGTGDFNGDGRDDIFWVSDGGEVNNWLGTASGGFSANDANALTQYNGSYYAGSGDFNGDGRDDVLWWDYNYSISTWSGTPSGGFIQNAASPIMTNSVSKAPTGIGDFNGDGLDDILWRDFGTGELTNWLATPGGGFAVNDANALHQVPTYWQVAGVGDFNGDGRDDILWRSTTGTLSNWLGTATGGFVINDANAFTHIPLSWQVVGTGDYNGDGRDDILWRSDDGAVSNWLGTASGGFIINDPAAYAQVETSWHIGSNWDPWDY